MRKITAAMLIATAAAVAASFAPLRLPATQDTLASISPTELTRTAKDIPTSEGWQAH